MHRDGRQPQTLRLTIRRFSATNKWFSRESRQCPIPNQIGQKITSGKRPFLEEHCAGLQMYMPGKGERVGFGLERQEKQILVNQNLK